MASSLEKRAVVSSLIFRFPRGQTNPDVALFKRSDKVRTYQHHLAPISGSIERTDKDPLAAAWRELHEETTLTPASLALWRTGKPFSFSDASVSREWTVHPFAFRLKTDDAAAAIHTDWEHESWGWYDPQRVIDEIGGAHGVPRLTESLRRVWFEGEIGERAGRTLATGLERLRTDHASGSRELTAIAIRVFGDFIAELRGEGDVLDDEWWRRVRMAAWHLVKNGRESMGAATLSAVLGVLSEMESILQMQTESVQAKWERVLAVIDSQLQNRSSRATRLQESFVEYLQSTFLASGKREKLTVLTTSASSTIRDSLLNAYAALDLDTLELRVLESRPLFEGATLAASVLSQFQSRFQSSPDKHLRVKLYTDASAAVASQDVDIVLLGADQISATKGVSNKTGSLPLALSAKHISPGVKIVVLSEVEKINGTGGVVRDDHAEDNDPMEIVGTWKHDAIKGVDALKDISERATVEVQNIYFEWVPLDMVDAFVCEEGVLSVDNIRQKSEKLGELSQRYFGDL
ncbi:conserved hypothetical protein [Aspergillus terreus NIH2624]|uniref:Nudix hydrolase domain-containing protein n=1 Tax=Aspergillus terreus (strain NIH 2624 / FGSC A1156) TaxID=341663 RepID=Q0CZ25_ASPTN|nr:uncharacterized protein ATEG_01059 [Aspergillus terreus NIH2624]EAU37816.1 conserved hypothetical protein [Aspergillus terreus NIH2624]